MKEMLENNPCTHGGDMLAYLYNEMNAADRNSFELHLADCGACIDDFAELSQSRYPVFQWKQLEFDPLPTPRVVIPVEEAASVSWLDKLRASFAFRPALAFGSLTAIAVISAFAGFVLIGGSNTSEIAGERVSIPAMPTPEVVNQSREKVMERPVVVDDPKILTPSQAGPKMMKASTSAPKPAVRPVRPKASQQAKRIEPIPALNAVEEEEDDSLRLADIFDEIGTSE